MFETLPEILQEHSRRTAKAVSYMFGVIICKNDLYEEEQALYTVQEVETAVLYRDIGYLMLPDTLFGKESSCNNRERDLVKNHTLYGAGIIEHYRMQHKLPQKETDILRLAAEVAISHHEWWNGKGYPYGEMATAISIISRITAIINYYDTVLWDRNRGFYLSPESSLKELEKQSGSQFDPRLVEKFIAIYNSSIELQNFFTDVK